MEPHLSVNDKLLFYKYLENCSVYFEFGSGGSTYQSNIRPNIHKIYSVESDYEWHKTLKEQTSTDKIVFLFNEMDSKPNTWGYPGSNSTEAQKINYSNQIVYLSESKKNEIDLVFIDGRFRVACCLKTYNSVNDDCIIAFDDFLDRPQYHIVLKYFDIIDKTIDERMVVLRKKPNKVIPKELISYYELIPN